jgi:translation initiation factor 3 subunit G
LKDTLPLDSTPESSIPSTKENGVEERPPTLTNDGNPLPAANSIIGAKDCKALNDEPLPDSKRADDSSLLSFQSQEATASSSTSRSSRRENGSVGTNGWTQVGARGAAATTGKYVPPAARAGLSGLTMKPEGRTDDLNTIRVTNISENTTEADLQDLFKPFGRISRVYLAKDKETLQSRGFALVSFVNKDDAARAMEKLQGFGYEHTQGSGLDWYRI